MLINNRSLVNRSARCVNMPLGETKTRKKCKNLTEANTTTRISSLSQADSRSSSVSLRYYLALSQAEVQG